MIPGPAGDVQLRGPVPAPFPVRIASVLGKYSPWIRPVETPRDSSSRVCRRRLVGMGDTKRDVVTNTRTYARLSSAGTDNRPAGLV
jgi:hypothetical protein